MTPFPDRKIERDHYDRSSLFGGKARDGVWEGHSIRARGVVGTRVRGRHVAAARGGPILAACRSVWPTIWLRDWVGSAEGGLCIEAPPLKPPLDGRGTGNLSARKQAEAKKLRSAVVAPHPNHEQGQGKNRAHVRAFGSCELATNDTLDKTSLLPPGTDRTGDGPQMGRPSIERIGRPRARRSAKSKSLIHAPHLATARSWQIIAAKSVVAETIARWVVLAPRSAMPVAPLPPGANRRIAPADGPMSSPCRMPLMEKGKYPPPMRPPRTGRCEHSPGTDRADRAHNRPAGSSRACTCTRWATPGPSRRARWEKWQRTGPPRQTAGATVRTCARSVRAARPRNRAACGTRRKPST